MNVLDALRESPLHMVLARADATRFMLCVEHWPGEGQPQVSWWVAPERVVELVVQSAPRNGVRRLRMTLAQVQHLIALSPMEAERLVGFPLSQLTGTREEWGPVDDAVLAEIQRVRAEAEAEDARQMADLTGEVMSD